MSKSPKCDIGPGHIRQMKLSNKDKNVKTRAIRVELPRNDISSSLWSLEVGHITVTRSHYSGFMTRYVPIVKKSKNVNSDQVISGQRISQKRKRMSKLKKIRVELFRIDISLSLRSLQVGQLEVSESHFLGFMTRYVPKVKKSKNVISYPFI